MKNVPEISNVQFNRKHCKESVTYNHLISQVTALCETVQNSQHHCKMVGNFIGRWIDKLRTKQNFSVEFLQLPSLEVKDDEQSVHCDKVFPLSILVTNKRHTASE